MVLMSVIFVGVEDQYVDQENVDQENNSDQTME
jgi:hypothetical protein